MVVGIEPETVKADRGLLDCCRWPALSSDRTARLPPTSAVVSSVVEVPAPLAVLPAVSVAEIETVIRPSASVDRLASAAKPPATCAPLWSVNVTVAVASASRPETV